MSYEKELFALRCTGSKALVGGLRLLLYMHLFLFTASIVVYEFKSCCCSCSCCSCDTLQIRPYLYYEVQMAHFKVLVCHLKYIK